MKMLNMPRKNKTGIQRPHKYRKSFSFAMQLCAAVFVIHLLTTLAASPTTSSSKSPSKNKLQKDSPSKTIEQNSIMPLPGAPTPPFNNNPSADYAQMKNLQILAQQFGPQAALVALPSFEGMPMPAAAYRTIRTPNGYETIATIQGIPGGGGNVGTTTTTTVPTNQFPHVTDPTLVCPTGFKISGGKCVREEYSNAKLGCPDGWNLSDGICRGVEVQPPRHHCSDDFVERSGVCVKEISAPHHAECPEGYALTSETTCLKELKTNAIPRCEEKGAILQTYGDALDRFRCVSECVSSAIRNCPTGFILQNNQCQRKEVMPSVYVCPAGLSLQGTNCVSTIEELPVLQCPSDYVLENGMCVIERVIEAEWRCISGVPVNRTCVVENPVDYIYRCPSGFTLNQGTTGTNCVRQDVRNPRIGCPLGSVQNGIYCRQLHSEEEMFLPLSSSPPPKVSLVPSSSLFIKRRLKGETCPEGYQLSPSGRCISVQTVDPEVTCPQNTILSVSNGCVRRQTTTAVPYCNGEPQQSNAPCKVREAVPPSLMCQQNFLLTGDRCQRQITTPARTHCDTQGFFKDENGNCLRLEILEPQYECSANLRLMSDGTCQEVQYTDPQFTCPPQFQLNNPVLYGMNNRTVPSTRPAHAYCYSREITKPTLKCPTGFSEDAITNRCTRVITKESAIICDTDFEIVIDQCIKPVRRQPIILCPVGTQLRTDKVINSSEISNTNNNLCVTIVRTEPTRVCPPGFTYDTTAQICVRIQPMPALTSENTNQQPTAVQSQLGVMQSQLNAMQSQISALQPQRIPTNQQFMHQPGLTLASQPSFSSIPNSGGGSGSIIPGSHHPSNNQHLARYISPGVRTNAVTPQDTARLQRAMDRLSGMSSTGSKFHTPPATIITPSVERQMLPASIPPVTRNHHPVYSNSPQQPFSVNPYTLGGGGGVSSYPVV